MTDEQTPPDEQPANQKNNPDQASERITYTSDELMQGRREVWIEHNGEMYRLRVTALGKLYLTK